MFTGIVETIGRILHIELLHGCKHFTISPAESLLNDLKIGDSIAVNGVCLTITHITATDFNVTAVPETLRLTNLASLHLNDLVNLERSLQHSARIGGHYVQGHVDGLGEIIECNNDHAALLVKVSTPKHLANYIVNKGYIALDGMSITIIQSEPTWFTVTLIPHTQAVTIANQYKAGSLINIEVDMMGKYIEKLIGVYTHANT